MFGNAIATEKIKLKESILIDGRYIDSVFKKTIKELPYCVPNYPSLEWFKGSVIYTVVMTYIIPLTIIILCYMRVILRIMKKSNDNIWENQTASIHFTSTKRSNNKQNGCSSSSNNNHNEMNNNSSNNNNNSLCHNDHSDDVYEIQLARLTVNKNNININNSDYEDTDDESFKRSKNKVIK